MKQQYITEEEYKKRFIDLSVDNYFIVSHNPLVNLAKRILNEPVTKEEMKIKLRKQNIK